ncbi:hypothetical protein A3Q56_02229 [Intoshia linei]|uniref:Uncharacterized protein n=1 Tax=Intoshia linei TaxID=1819745 RepID=A0A177B8Y8_9BILA|nr:hypothetical protein A3Q56_02229 [Intoshia linei]
MEIIKSKRMKLPKIVKRKLNGYNPQYVNNLRFMDKIDKKKYNLPLIIIGKGKHFKKISNRTEENCLKPTDTANSDFCNNVKFYSKCKLLSNNEYFSKFNQKMTKTYLKPLNNKIFNQRNKFWNSYRGTNDIVNFCDTFPGSFAFPVTNSYKLYNRKSYSIELQRTDDFLYHSMFDSNQFYMHT